MTLSDSDRPPVLAHQRFVAERDAFVQLDLRERFSRIHRTNLWGADTSVSGLGSESDATAVLREQLPALLHRLGAASMLDAPCGDAGWINRSNLTIRYVGVDIVPELVQRLRARAAAGEIGGDYQLADITRDPLPRCDAILCRDCLVHLSFSNIARAITNFQRSGAIWLIGTTFPDWQNNRDCEDGDWRALNFERPPFCWQHPVDLINEDCREAGGGWRDKGLAVWRLSDLPALQ
jgi:hypothetical protein